MVDEKKLIVHFKNGDLVQISSSDAKLIAEGMSNGKTQHWFTFDEKIYLYIDMEEVIYIH